eukprot:4682-Heterococcus_DN1.PRE.4
MFHKLLLERFCCKSDSTHASNACLTMDFISPLHCIAPLHLVVLLDTTGQGHHGEATATSIP